MPDRPMVWQHDNGSARAAAYSETAGGTRNIVRSGSTAYLPIPPWVATRCSHMSGKPCRQ